MSDLAVPRLSQRANFAACPDALRFACSCAQFHADQRSDIERTATASCRTLYRDGDAKARQSCPQRVRSVVGLRGRGGGTAAAGLEPEGNAQGELRAHGHHQQVSATEVALQDSDDETQPFQRRSSHSISWQVFAAQSRLSADPFRVRAPYGCHTSEAVEKNNRGAGASAVAPRCCTRCWRWMPTTAAASVR